MGWRGGEGKVGQGRLEDERRGEGKRGEEGREDGMDGRGGRREEQRGEEIHIICIKKVPEKA